MKTLEDLQEDPNAHIALCWGDEDFGLQLWHITETTRYSQSVATTLVSRRYVVAQIAGDTHIRGLVFNPAEVPHALNEAALKVLLLETLTQIMDKLAVIRQAESPAPLSRVESKRAQAEKPEPADDSDD